MRSGFTLAAGAALMLVDCSKAPEAMKEAAPGMGEAASIGGVKGLAGEGRAADQAPGR